jgi:hypothetical protein
VPEAAAGDTDAVNVIFAPAVAELLELVSVVVVATAPVRLDAVLAEPQPATRVVMKTRKHRTAGTLVLLFINPISPGAKHATYR